MGITHFDKVSGINGLYVGKKGEEKVAVGADGYLRQNGTKITVSATAINNLIQGAGTGYKIKEGTVTVTGTAEVVTGLNKVYNVIAVIQSDISLNAMFVSAMPSATAGRITIKVWKPTSATDITPVASTTATTVGWIAIGA